jgi:hypothetical protein
MRLVISIFAVAAIMLSTITLATVANAVELNVVGPNSATVLLGQQVAVDVTLTNLSGDTVAGIGVSVYGYDESVADFASGQAVSSYLNTSCTAPGVCSGGLENLRGGSLFESAIAGNGPRVQIALSATLTPSAGIPGVDQGLDGNAGTPMFSVLFDAIAPGVTTLFIDTAYYGDAIVYPDGSIGQAQGSTFTINVIPEPGTALLMGLGLLGLAASGRTRLPEIPGR